MGSNIFRINIIQNFRESLDNLRNIFFKSRIDFRNILTSLVLSLGFTIYNRKLNRFPSENLRRLPDLNLWSNKNNNKWLLVRCCWGTFFCYSTHPII